MKFINFKQQKMGLHDPTLISQYIFYASNYKTKMKFINFKQQKMGLNDPTLILQL